MQSGLQQAASMFGTLDLMVKFKTAYALIFAGAMALLLVRLFSPSFHYSSSSAPTGPVYAWSLFHAARSSYLLLAP
jgi:hypothetical protein